jgi:hypothetical protein
MINLIDTGIEGLYTRYQLQIDDEIFTGYSKDATISHGEQGVSVVIQSIDLSRKIVAYPFSQIPDLIRTLELKPRYSSLQGEGMYLNTSVFRNDSGEFSLSWVIHFYLADWKQTFSISNYVEEFTHLLDQSTKKWKMNSDFAGMGFSIFFSVEDIESTIKAEFLKHEETVRKLHELTKSSLRSKLQPPNVEQIIRSIEFPPEYYHSGITILSYFADVLRHKKLSEQVKVVIEQSGLTVRLVIDSPTGQLELIERTLETYALVVTGKQPIDTLTTDPYEITELKNQLRIASVQIENQRDMLALKNSEVTYLRSEVEDTKASLNRIEKRADEDRARLMSLIEGLIEHNSELSSGFRELAEQAVKFQNKKLANALESLHKMVERGVQGEDRDEAIKNLTIIQQEDAGVFGQVAEMAKDAISGAAGSFLYSWIQALVYGLPK